MTQRKLKIRPGDTIPPSNERAGKREGKREGKRAGKRASERASEQAQHTKYVRDSIAVVTISTCTAVPILLERKRGDGLPAVVITA